MSELPYPFPIRWYGDALDAYAPFADRPGAFMVAINKRYTLIGWQPLATFSATGAFVTMDGRTRIGNPAEALLWYRKVLENDPENRDAQVALIRASQKAGDYEAAVKALDVWIRNNPEDLSAVERRAEVLQEAAADTVVPR
jgi:tetratricopeptide (TPR) repeat protein